MTRTARPGLHEDPWFPPSRRLVRGTGPEKETFRITERSGWSLSKAPFRPQPLPSQGGSLRNCPENPFRAGAWGNSCPPLRATGRLETPAAPAFLSSGP